MSQFTLPAVGLFLIVMCVACTGHSTTAPYAPPVDWLLVDDFETNGALLGWTNIDAQNETNPYVPNPQISAIRAESGSDNHYMLRKPAADGVAGNRKALGFKALPVPIGVGQTFTLYTRINIASFPNNQSFGLSNAAAPDIRNRSVINVDY